MTQVSTVLENYIILPWSLWWEMETKVAFGPRGADWE